MSLLNNIILFASIIFSFKSFSQSNVKAFEKCNYKTYDVQQINGAILKEKKIDGFIDFKKDTIIFMNIGIGEAIFLKDYVIDKKMHSRNYILYNYPPKAFLTEENMDFYNSLNILFKKYPKLKILSLRKIETYENYFELINYIINYDIKIPDKIKGTIHIVDMTATDSNSETEFEPLADTLINNFETNGSDYEVFFGKNFNLFREVITELKLKKENNEGNILEYRKEKLNNLPCYGNALIIIERSKIDLINPIIDVKWK